MLRWFRRTEMGLRVCKTDKAPGDAVASDPGAHYLTGKAQTPYQAMAGKS